MYDRVNEEMAWQRLVDLQREAENSRLLAVHGPAAVNTLAQRIAETVWAFARGVRPRWWAVQPEECAEAREVA